MRDEAFERRGGIGAGDQQVQIAHRFAAAAQAAGGRDRFHAGNLPQVVDQLRRHAFGVAQQVAAGALAVLRDGAQHLLFQLGAHARQHAQFLLLAERSSSSMVLRGNARR